MTDKTDRAGERIAKVIARAGLASRRDAERMVTDLRVTVNGRTVSNVAHNVVPGDRVAVDGKPLPTPEGARLWLYHKPAGLVTTEKDEKDRETVFDALPPELGRVLSVGRLDLNSEGLLLLTNDGGLKRQLELPATGWLRRYRVRVNGTPEDAVLDRLRTGITVEGDDGPETFAGMQITLDRQQGANAWLTVGLREGRNREVRRAFAAVDLYVNRLIRVSYGPFQLGTLAAGAVEEVRPRVLRDQLGDTWDGELAEARKESPMPEEKEDARAGRDGKGAGKGRKPRPSGDRLIDKGKGGRRGRDDERPRFGKGKPAGKPPRADRADRAARPDKPRTGKPPVTRNDGSGSRPDRAARPKDSTPRETKAERTARLRADTSVSLRKGGQRGRGVSKPRKAPSKKRMKKPDDE
ncbi:pseudouridine synthase [Jannaschia marina]|uniref:pseudouridine synthase n=1 Tax=Jannaschia marina TaxID=2741674 RepID=UPI0015CDF61A|nr:pseudouridine synthase [Jannaschia marina]